MHLYQYWVRPALGAFGLGNSAWAAGKIKPAASSALIVVDVQHCFIEGGNWDSPITAVESALLAMPDELKALLEEAK